MSDEDRGQGDTERFPADDLERLYKRGGLDPQARILGRELNRILNTKRFRVDAWYVVTAEGIVKV